MVVITLTTTGVGDGTTGMVAIMATTGAGDGTIGTVAIMDITALTTTGVGMAGMDMAETTLHTTTEEEEVLAALQTEPIILLEDITMEVEEEAEQALWSHQEETPAHQDL
jgi:hypothetical protein